MSKYVCLNTSSWYLASDHERPDDGELVLVRFSDNTYELVHWGESWEAWLAPDHSPQLTHWMPFTPPDLPEEQPK